MDKKGSCSPALQQVLVSNLDNLKSGQTEQEEEMALTPSSSLLTALKDVARMMMSTPQCQLQRDTAKV